MPWLVTIENPETGSRGTIRIEARRNEFPPTVQGTDPATGQTFSFPIVARRWVSKHSPEAQPSPRAVAKRKARETRSTYEPDPLAHVHPRHHRQMLRDIIAGSENIR